MSLERLYYQIISPDRKSPWEPVFRFLKFLSVPYGWIHELRLWAYRVGLFGTRRLNRRVISVGNLTLGGTGKSPVVMMIAETLRDRGFKPGILSRGYGAMVKEQVTVVCDGRQVLLDPAYAGDEPVMMARRLQNIPIVIGPNRYQTGSYAISRFKTDTLILDDGYQHVQLARDLNILLIDAGNPFGNGCLFPAGELREPLEKMNRADLIIITRGEEGEPGPVIPLPENVPVIRAAYRLRSLIRMDGEEKLSVDDLRDQPVAAFCGIAQPESFRKTLEKTGAKLVFFEPWPDHHPFTPADLKSFEERAIQAGAKMILVTEKDSVKLAPSVCSLSVFYTVMEVEILEGREIFDRIIPGRQEGPMAESLT